MPSKNLTYSLLLIIITIIFSNQNSIAQFENDVDKFNHSVRLLERKSLDSAKSILNKLRFSPDKEIKSKSLYNLACIFLDEKKYDSSMVYFSKSLLLSNDSNARYNYIYSKLKSNQESAKKQKEQSKPDQTTKPEASSSKEIQSKMSKASAQQILQSIKDAEGELLRKIREIENSKDRTRQGNNSKRW